MEQNPKYKIPELILKNFFDKDQAKQQLASRDLETFMKQTLDRKNIHQSLYEIVSDFKYQLFDPSSLLRNQIIKGDIYPVLEMIKLIKSFELNSDSLFLMIHPIILLYKELEPKVIVDYSNHLISLLKNQSMIVLKFFNDIIEGLIYLTIHQEQEVRNTGNTLDELLKETLKNAYKDNLKSEAEFNVKNFIQKLFEKIRTNHVEVKKFVLSWFIVIGSIPQLKLITDLPEILPFLFVMLGDKTKTVNASAEQCLNILKEDIDKHYEEYYEDDSAIMDKIVTIIISNCNSQNEQSKNFAFEWINKFLQKYLKIMNEQIIRINKLVTPSNLTNSITSQSKYASAINKGKPPSKEKTGIIRVPTNPTNSKIPTPPIFQGLITNIQSEMENNMRFTSTFQNSGKKRETTTNQIPYHQFPLLFEVILSQKKDRLAESTNTLFEKIIETIPPNTSTAGLDIQKLEEVIRKTFENNKDISMELILSWCERLFNKFGDEMFKSINTFIESFSKILPNNNNPVFFRMIEFLCLLAKSKEEYIEPVVNKITNKFLQDHLLLNNQVFLVIKTLSEKLHVTIVYTKFADTLLKCKDIAFISEMICQLNIFLLTEASSKDVRTALTRYRQENLKDESIKAFFEKIFTVWSYNPIATLILCVISEYFELSFHLILKLGDVKLDKDYYKQLSQIVQLIESSMYNNIRIRLLDPLKNIYLVKTLYGILMLLPQGHAYNSLANRLKSIETLLEMEIDISQLQSDDEKFMEDVNYFLNIFSRIQQVIKQNTKSIEQ